MIKYLRDKITGRSPDDLLLRDNISSMKKIHSQTSLNDVMSISTNSYTNDILSSDQTTSQVEKLNAAAGGSGIRSMYSSSPIIIPKHPPHSNTSSQSSSSYTSVVDQMSPFNETLSDGKLIDIYMNNEYINIASLPTLPSTCQYLEHSAARDRISVKNKRRQPIKQKLSTLREHDDNQMDLFSSTKDDRQTISLPPIESKVQQPIVEISDLNTVRTRLRDHLTENISSITPIIPTYVSSVQRSMSFKRPQELTERQFQEHIYDNSDLFKHHQTILPSETEIESSTNNFTQIREHSTSINTRLRPITMHISTNNDKQTINEFENVFNQLKKRGSIKKVQTNEESIPEPMQLFSSSVSNENEPIVEISSVSQQTPNRRKTVTGVHLLTNNKVAADDNHKPTPSWIDIAKQKQSKFQSISIEKSHHKEPEQQQTTSSLEPKLVSNNQVNISYNIAVVKENIFEDTRSNRKSMFESVIPRRLSPTNTHVIERDSIRALKAGNPNRINNLIQLFDK